MDDICRLCCSTTFVTNKIFDEETALYLKMALYLPIKVFKNDRLPQKICDKCSCKVNDIYQFCNETIEVQKRLRSIFLADQEIKESLDITLESHITDVRSLNQATQTEETPDDLSVPVKVKVEPVPDPPELIKQEDSEENKDHILNERNDEYNDHPDNISDSSDNISLHNISKNKKKKKDVNGQVEKHRKRKPKLSEWILNALPAKQNQIDSEKYEYNNDPANISSDSSDNVSLINIKKKKKSKKEVNGQGEKRGKKRKPKLREWIMNALPDGAHLDKSEDAQLQVKHEKRESDSDAQEVEVKRERDLEGYRCCICFQQCYSRADMLQHYREHLPDAESPPPAPPPPDVTPLRCVRCRKVLERHEWSSHWTRHWERDRRPYRCSLCEKTFREPHLILKHGLTHKIGEEDIVPPSNRFICDLCPEGFVYMRYLLSHRLRSHPEAAGRALSLRCAVCSRQFAHLNSLRRHLRAHTGERNFLCNVCGKSLTSREHLKFHLRIHTGYKPNVCKTCGKGFVKKCNLTLHERVHSGEKPHVCSHCGKAFSQRSTLVIHERYHSGARPYTCALCGRGFVAKGLLSMHLKTTCI